jgi:hypothetical protein
MTIIFTEEFFEDLSADPQLALSQICSLFLLSRDKTNANNLNYYLEFYAIVEAFVDEHKLKLKLDLPEIRSLETQAKKDKVAHFAATINSSLVDYVRENKESGELDKFRRQFSTKFGNPFIYEFTDGDIARIQLLLNELRDLISSSSDFEEKHKRRLHKRLENLQSELHKKMADLDHLWGLLGDAGVAIGKFGEDSKPIVDRIREITDITWKTQSRAEELPSNTPSPELLKYEDEVGQLK